MVSEIETISVNSISYRQRKKSYLAAAVKAGLKMSFDFLAYKLVGSKPFMEKTFNIDLNHVMTQKFLHYRLLLWTLLLTHQHPSQIIVFNVSLKYWNSGDKKLGSKTELVN